MFELSPTIIEDAEELAAELIESGEKIAVIPFGESDSQNLVVSSDENLVDFLHYFDLKGTTFYVGNRK
jgi:hypothetical protein